MKVRLGQGGLFSYYVAGGDHEDRGPGFQHEGYGRDQGFGPYLTEKMVCRGHLL